MSQNTNVIDHKSHSKHLLKQVFKNIKFECKACKTPGRGLRYSCDPCDFSIHALCGTCPEAIQSFTHPKHLLQLCEHSFMSHPKCKLCQTKIDGMKYKCKECNYNMHPLCTQLPEVLTDHVKHPLHPLTLQTMKKSRKCDVCEETCKKWRYTCGECDVHIHVGCLLRKSKGDGDDDDDGYGGVFGKVIRVLNVAVDVAGALA